MAVSRYKSHRYNYDCVPSSGVFVIGLLVPSDAPVFVGGEAAKGARCGISFRARSVDFVPPRHSEPTLSIHRAAKTLQVRGLVHVVNAAMLVFIVLGVNTDLYIGSRTLYGLAIRNQTPKIFRKVTKWGVPVWALPFCWLFTFLVFMNLGKGPQDGVIITACSWSKH